jgi:5-deoxy-5-amino-3-dehydroquinate synthase
MRIVPVDLGERGYDVLVGEGARYELAATLAAVVPAARQAAIVTQPGIPVDVDAGIPADRFEVPDGEAAKSLGVVEVLCRGFARAGLARSDVVIAVGGGVVTDLAGFAAAAYHRGTAYANVATTLLGQVDAAIGGKTGVNLPEGKNLVGAFWQPRVVICDTEVLATLPPREWASGRGEMAKYALLAGGPASGAGPDPSLLELPLSEQVAVCAGMKADVVASDEREGDRRMVLNYGHTLAHALEATAFAPDSGLDLRHGEAVAVGLMFAALLAHRLGRIDDHRVEAHRRVLSAFDLSPLMPEQADPDRLVAIMARDKKARHDLSFVLDGRDGIEVVRGIDEADVVATLLEMQRRESGSRQ